MIIDNSEVVLSVRDLTAEVDGTPILNGVNLEVKAGEIHAIMGPNGSGKYVLEGVGRASSLQGYRRRGDLPGAESVGNGTGRTSQGWCVFKYPLEIPGVSNLDFLRVAYTAASSMV